VSRWRLRGDKGDSTRPIQQVNAPRIVNILRPHTC